MGQAERKWTDEQLKVGVQLYDDYELYASKALKIKPKDKSEGALVPFRFNTAQRYLHCILEDQKKRIGIVRAVILKGRQQGCSTYICGRYLHKSTLNYGIKAHIQTHEKKATGNLFSMTQRALNNIPDEWRPHIGVDNISGIVFDELDSAYSVGTAGGKESGRSDNIDLLHCSELGFWDRPTTHLRGLLAAAESAEEIVYESTANGMGNCFNRVYTKAQAGQYGDFIAIFIPWFWQEEYRKPVPEGFMLTEEEQKLVDTHDLFPEFDGNGGVKLVKGKIDLEQMAWRRNMISISDSEAAVNQEYPFDAKMAFQFSMVDSHIKAEDVLAAYNRPQYISYGAITAGFDPSFTDSGDRKAFVYRQGPNIWGLEYPKLKDHDAQVAFCKRKLNGNIYIDRLFIDAGGGGYAIKQCLDADGCGDRAEVVDSSRAAEESRKYANCKAEMADKLKIHLRDNNMPCSISVSAELKDALLTDLTAEGATEDRNNRQIMEKKEDVKARIGISPDGGDAVKLTYSRDVVREHVMGGDGAYTTNNKEDKVFRSLVVNEKKKSSSVFRSLGRK